MSDMSWEVVIGLEIHAQLTTKSKIFSSSSIAYGAEPNSQANNVDLGMPGMLPVLNVGVIDKSIKLGLALNAEIGRKSVFDRKTICIQICQKVIKRPNWSFLLLAKVP